MPYTKIVENPKSSRHWGPMPSLNKHTGYCLRRFYSWLGKDEKGYVEKDRLGRLRATYCSELAPVSLSFTRRKFKEQISVALMVPFLRRPFSTSQ
jgi:hypothetical protein